MRGDFPDVEITRVDVLEHPDQLLALGVRRYPAFASEGRVLSGFFLGKRRIRNFLRSLSDD